METSRIKDESNTRVLTFGLSNEELSDLSTLTEFQFIDTTALYYDLFKYDCIAIIVNQKNFTQAQLAEFSRVYSFDNPITLLISTCDAVDLDVSPYRVLDLKNIRKVEIQLNSSRKNKVLSWSFGSAAGFNLHGSYLILDNETTGLNPDKDEMIRISAIRVIDNSPVDFFDILVKPKVPMSSAVEKINRITNASLETAATIEEAIVKFEAFYHNELLVINNARFLLPFLENAYQKVGRSFSRAYIDPYLLAKKLYPNLPPSNIGKRYSYICPDLNTERLNDNEITYHLLQKIFERLDSN